MNKVLIKRNLMFIRNILLNISKDYVSYEYGKYLSEIEKDTKNNCCFSDICNNCNGIFYFSIFCN